MDKKQLIKDSQVHETDTGSYSVQITLLTAQILHLAEHLKIHKKDLHSKRGLLQMVAKRRKLIKHYEEIKPEEYAKLKEKLGIR
jgi:small subunit ribosomal protein S15